jgi:hypothetical protein
MRMAALLTVLAAALGAGCQATDIAWHQATFSITEHRAAEKAWRNRRWMYEGIPCKVSFKDGFVAGYRFARGGYDSCEPPMPKHYWRINGVTDEDRQRAQAWTDGFTHGTLAAQQDGCATQSALDAAAALAPAGTPEVNYFIPPHPVDAPENEMNVPPGAMPAYPNVPPSPGSPGPSTIPLMPQAPPQPMNPPPPAPGAEQIPGPAPVPNLAPAPAPPAASGYAPSIGGLQSIAIRPAPVIEQSAAPIPQQDAHSSTAPAGLDWQLPVNAE